MKPFEDYKLNDREKVIYRLGFLKGASMGLNDFVFEETIRIHKDGKKSESAYLSGIINEEIKILETKSKS